MRFALACNKLFTSLLASILSVALAIPSSAAQGKPPSFTPEQLDNIVSGIALYPGPLLAQAP